MEPVLPAPADTISAIQDSVLSSAPIASLLTETVFAPVVLQDTSSLDKPASLKPPITLTAHNGMDQLVFGVIKDTTSDLVPALLQIPTVRLTLWLQVRVFRVIQASTSMVPCAFK